MSGWTIRGIDLVSPYRPEVALWVSVAGGEVSVAGGEVSVAGGEVSVAGGEVSVAGGEVSVAGGEVSVAGGEVSVAGGEVSVAGGEVSVAGGCAAGAGLGRGLLPARPRPTGQFGMLSYWQVTLQPSPPTRLPSSQSS
ncbi:hypothetical protein [Sorangium sp. So ce1335]|uniref:hypothetical protein n=1 Tax=Sorangium sp. So ce1335 TaxID=3133335 RepID=UPI003F640F77